MLPFSFQEKGLGDEFQDNAISNQEEFLKFMHKKISITYDQEADVVYISFGESVPAVGEEIQEGVFARYDPNSEELIGLTVINFSKKFGIELKSG